MRRQRLTPEELRGIRERAEAYNQLHNGTPRLPPRPRSRSHRRPPQHCGRVRATQGPRAVLGLYLDATVQEIKSAYRALAMQHHPDHGGSTERMREINLAYAAIVG
jgi:DnaJ-domain-containing protein 1